MTRLAALAVILCAAWLFFNAGVDYWDRQWQLPSCEMTYMYPAFEAVQDEQLVRTSGRYNLYKYKDGQHNPGDGDAVLPVLFVPGHAGSYKQARSMASETARLWSKRTVVPGGAALKRVYLQWYSIDTQEELPAFDGPTLERQITFTLRCLSYLASTYNITTAVHPGIILIGHSMGGVVARHAAIHAATFPALGPSALALLLTLAAPHQRAPLPAHPSLARAYHLRPGLPVPAVPLVSLSGDYNDTQVASVLTSVQGLHPPALSLQLSTMSVPGAWVAPAHVCIVWCNQLLPPLTRAIANAAHNAWFHHFQNSTVRGGRSIPGVASSGSEGSRGTDGYDHAEVFLSSARQQLRSSVLPGRLQALLDEPFQGSSALPDLQTSHTQTPRSADIGGAESAASHTLDQALTVLEGQGCYGANLMWYSQYNQPTDVTDSQHKQRGLLRLHGPGGAKKVQGKTGRLYRWTLPSAGCKACGSAGSDSASLQLTFSLVISGSKPCEGFRLWVHRTVRGAQAQAAAAAAQQVAAEAEAAALHAGMHDGDGADIDAGQHSQDAGKSEESSEGQSGASAGKAAASAGEAVMLNAAVDVTHLAAWLPLTMRHARRHVRDMSLHKEIMGGVDYNATSTWAIVLPPSLLKDISRVTLWAGPAANASAFHLAAQLWPLAPSVPPSAAVAAGRRNGAQAVHTHVSLGWSSLFGPLTRHMGGFRLWEGVSGRLPGEDSAFRPLTRDVGGPQAVQVSIDLWPLEQSARKNFPQLPPHQQGQEQGQGRVQVSSDSLNTAAAPVKAVMPVHQMLSALLQMSGVLPWLSLGIKPLGAATSTSESTSNSSAVISCRHSLVVMPQQSSQVVATSGQRSVVGEAVVANLTRYSLAECLGETGAGCKASVLLDPGCRYSIELQLDVSGRLLGLLLARLPELWLMAQALLLAHAARLVSCYPSSSKGLAVAGAAVAPGAKGLTGPLQGLCSAIGPCLWSPIFVVAAVLWAPVSMRIAHSLTSINWEAVSGSPFAALLMVILGRSSCSPSALAAAVWVAALPLLPGGSAGRFAQPQHRPVAITQGQGPSAANTRRRGLLPGPKLGAFESWARSLVLALAALVLCYTTFQGDTLRPLSPVEALLLLPLMAVVLVTMAAAALALVRALVQGVLATVHGVVFRRVMPASTAGPSDAATDVSTALCAVSMAALCGLALLHMSLGLLAAALVLLLMPTSPSGMPPPQQPPPSQQQQQQEQQQKQQPPPVAPHSKAADGTASAADAGTRCVHATLQATMCTLFSLGALVCAPSGWAWLSLPESYRSSITIIDVCLSQPVVGACCCLAFARAGDLKARYQAFASQALHACASAAFAAAVFGAGYAGYVIQALAAVVMWVLF